MTRYAIACSAMIIAAAVVPRAVAQCAGEPASASPCAPRIISGAPGVYEIVIDVSTAVGAFVPACGFNVGHGVWFEVTPTVPSLLTFSTCHPATTYDTVVQPWLLTGDCEFPQRLDDLCIDDTPGSTCNNGCSGAGSTIAFHANAGVTYLIEVGSYNNNGSGCTLCLGVLMTICGGDSTPPTCVIADPAALGCTCNPVSVIGTVDDPDGGILGYTLEYAADGSTAWTVVADGSSSIVNGMLGTWNTVGLPAGYYVLRLTTTNVCGLSSTDVQTVWVDVGFDTLDFTSPPHTTVVGGSLCLVGTVFDSFCFDNYTAKYRPVSGGTFQPVDPVNPVYLSPVVNSMFALWNTLVLGLPDGDYEIQVRGETTCGDAATDTRVVSLDNTPPVAFLSTPLECDYVDGVVPIVGTASDAHLESWTLQYTGGSSNTWTTIATGSMSVSNGMLASWDTTALPACAYTLRLVATDTAILNCNSATRQRSEFAVSVNVGFCGDFDTDDDGDVDLFDYSAFLTAFTGALP